MPHLGLLCRVCNGVFDSRADWNNHLREPSHLELARERVLQWGEGERSSVLVLFALLPLGNDRRVIEWLSKDFGAMVTDFVWFEGRPKIGYVQLESSDEVQRIVKALGAQATPIDAGAGAGGQACLVKDGGSYTDQEWRGMLPDPPPQPQPQTSPPPENNVPASVVAPTPLPHQNAGAGGGIAASSTPLEAPNPHPDGNHVVAVVPSPSVPPPPSEPNPDPGRITTSPQPLLQLENIHQTSNPPLPPPPTTPSTTTTASTFTVMSATVSAPEITKSRGVGLTDHLSSIQNLVKIQEGEYSTALLISRQVQEALNQCNSDGGGSKFRANLCHYWNLKLRTMSMTPPQAEESRGTVPIWILLQKAVDAVGCIKRIHSKELTEVKNKLFSMVGDKKFFLKYEVVTSHNPNPDSSKDQRIPPFTIKHPDSDTLVDIRIVSEPSSHAEDRVWRLIQYLCRFDPHCLPILAVVCYWANLNSILIGEKSEGAQSQSQPSLADHSPLIWLLLMHFQMEKLIPTTKSIFDRPNNSRTMYKGVDISFSENYALVKSWIAERSSLDINTSDESFAQEVFKRIWKFFAFCESLLGEEGEEENDWILNSREAQLIPKSDFLASSEPSSTSTNDWNLTNGQIESIQKALGRNPDKIVMLHPFFVTRIIPTSNIDQAIGAMRETGRRLNSFLANGLDEEKRELDLEEFVGLLKVDRAGQEESEMLVDDLANLTERSQTDHVEVDENADNPSDPHHEDQLEGAPSPKRRRLMESGNVPLTETIWDVPSSQTTSGEQSQTLSSLSSTDVEFGWGDYLRFILRRIEIPQQDYKIAEWIISRLQQVLSKDNNATTQVIMTRHWRLRLEYSPKMADKNIALSVLICKATTSKERHAELKELKELDAQIVKLAGKGRRRYLFSKSYELMSTRHQLEPRPRDDDGWGILRYTIRHPKTNRPFDANVVNDPRFIVEAQIFRLVEYLCTFHPLCYPVLAMTYYWAKVNSIAMGKFTGSSYYDLGSPSALNWLLIVFFQKEGLIPSPRLVLERPHQRRTFEGVDVGFSDDARFTDDWRASNKKNRNQNPQGEQFAREVFKTFHGFLSFCYSELGGELSAMGRDRVVVNTRDGEIIPMEPLLSSASPTEMRAWKLTPSEITQLTEKTKPRSSSPDWIIMLNPFSTQWKISTTDGDLAIMGSMRKTARELRHYLESEQGKQMLPLYEFLKLFKVKK